MRIIAWIALVLTLAAPATAQEASVYEQYDAIAETLGQGRGSDDYLTTKPAQLLDGLAGDWFPIGNLQPTSDNPTLFAEGCEKFGSRVTIRDAFSFDLTRFPNADTSVTTTYSSRGGNAFGTYTDPVALLHWLGLDKPDTRSGPIARALADYNQTATLLRPSPDVLVIQYNYGAPQIYGRCSA